MVQPDLVNYKPVQPNPEAFPRGQESRNWANNPEGNIFIFLALALSIQNISIQASICTDIFPFPYCIFHLALLLSLMEVCICYGGGLLTVVWWPLITSPAAPNAITRAISTSFLFQSHPNYDELYHTDQKPPSSSFLLSAFQPSAHLYDLCHSWCPPCFFVCVCGCIICVYVWRIAFLCLSPPDAHWSHDNASLICT